MIRNALLILTTALTTAVSFAHQMTPTYIKLSRTSNQEVLQTTVTITNRRNDVNYFELSVFNDEWKPVPFATFQRVIEIPFSKSKSASVYIKRTDSIEVAYVCSSSKIVKVEQTKPIVISKVCSKMK